MDMHFERPRNELSNQINKIILKNECIESVKELILDNYGNDHYIGSAFVVPKDYDKHKIKAALFDIENEIYNQLHIVVRLHIN